MTPPTSARPATVAQRTWRHQRRLRLLRSFGGACAFGPEGCDGRLEFAHRFPERRAIGADGRAVHRSTDAILNAVSADPFAFALLCRAHHHSADGPAWRGFAEERS
jgi:hypothetical protein